MGKDTEFNHYKRTKELLRDIYSVCGIYHLSGEKFREYKSERLFNSNDFKRITQTHQCCIFAQNEILFNNLFQYHLIYLYEWIDGNWYTSDEIQNLPNWVNWEYFTKYQPALQSGYFWKDERDKPF